MIGDMASCVDRLGLISPRTPMLIEHHPSHLNKGPILALNNTILLREENKCSRTKEAQKVSK
jgi:hypothetical protein